MRSSLLLSATVILSAPLPYAAATDFHWNDPGGGSFFSAGNWSPAGGPPNDATDTANYDSIFGSYEVIYGLNATNHSVNVTIGQVTFNMLQYLNTGVSSTYTLAATRDAAAHIGSVPGSLFPATLIIDGAGGFFETGIVASSILHIGRDANSQGVLKMRNAAKWESPQTTFVGFNGSGTLEMTAESFMQSSQGVVGFAEGSAGTVTLDGAFWSMTDGLNVGVSGSGNMTLVDAEVFTQGESHMAMQRGSSSTMHLSGNSDLHVDTFYVGGSSSEAGGSAELTLVGLAAGLDVDEDLIVRPAGKVAVDNAIVIVAGSLTLNSGARFDFLDGRVDAGTLTGSPGTMNWMEGSLFITGGDLSIDSTGPLGTNVTVGAGKLLDVSGTLRVAPAGPATLAIEQKVTSNAGAIGNPLANVGTAVVTVAGPFGEWTANGDMAIGGRDGVDVAINQNAKVTSTDVFVATDALSSADVTVETGGQWTSNGSAYLGGDATAAGGSGTTTVGGGGKLTATSQLTVWDRYVLNIDGGTVSTPMLQVTGTVNYTGTLDFSGDGPIGSLQLSGGTVNADTIDFGGQSLSGFGALNGNVIVGGSVTATGDLTLGNGSSFIGVQIGGSLNVGTHTVRINSAGFFPIGIDTMLTGGRLVAPGGVALPTSENLVASGTITARVVSQAGSIIQASGDLKLGDDDSPAGFFSDGELRVGPHTVSLHDANEAVLGSQTSLGADGNPGTLMADRGAVVEFGKNVTGFGMFDTPDDPVRPLINNGSISGITLAQPITLTGYVKGVGTCDNCHITGTDAPGFSTASVNRGSVRYNGSLEIEIGGLIPGSEFDQLNHVLGSGIANLGGTLDVSLIDGFTPALGDAFPIITASGGVQNTFASELLPALGAGKRFDVVYGAHDVVLSVVLVGLPGDYNQDGVVDSADYTLWRNTLGSTIDLAADGNGNGVIDSADYGTWKTNFGNGAGNAVAGSNHVPELATHMLLSLALALNWIGSRRGSQFRLSIRESNIPATLIWRRDNNRSHGVASGT